MEHIIEYFNCGFTTKEILSLLHHVHCFQISKRTLERFLKNKHLWRRKNLTNETEVARFIQQQLSTSGQLHGYRWMHQKCLLHGIKTSRETVRQILRLIDGDGVELRARNRLRRRVYHSRGPNFVWHIDGYDKLKPYGIAISGCIDGYSRKMIWLEAFRTNNDPKVIAGYYMDAVIQSGGCPERVRLDRGTENVCVGDLQKFLRLPDGERAAQDSAIFGPSTGNQRIEQWWLTLRKQCVQFWLDLFEKLKEDGHFTGTFLDKSLAQFCFMNTIQEELDEICWTWNNHRIRPSHNSRAPNGRPSLMYALPNLYGTTSYLHAVNEDSIQTCLEECAFKDFPCDKDIYYLCADIISENNLEVVDEVYANVDLYLKLREIVLDMLG
nr:uncharacterized protein LOC111838278 [Paramormyrops kingsleyae]